METRKLGKSDLNVSVIGMGCWQYGGGSYWGEQSQADVNQVVHQALDQGVNFFDTAEMYNDGKSEESLGIALKGQRDRAIIGTKFNPSLAYPKDLIKSCEDSLKRLQTDYIDVFMLHWPINETSIKHYSNDQQKISNPPQLKEVLDTLDKLKREGKIRHFGVSNHGISQMSELLEQGVEFVSNELIYNLISRGIEGEIMSFCETHEIGIIGYSPLHQGLLTGKVHSTNEVNPRRATSRHFHFSRSEFSRHQENGAENEVNDALRKLIQLSHDLGVDMTVLSLAWVIANKRISTMIVGSRNEQQLALNLQAASFKTTPDIMEELNTITQPIVDTLGYNPDYFENTKLKRIF
jgi:aryl-alcohol dehydrogenase-like predicted oxidoreductase